MSRPIDPAEHANGRTDRAARGPANVFLVGLSGSGKSPVGRLLARRLGWRFVDTDQEIRRRTGRTVQQIFRDDGEAAFRAVESEVIRDACARAHQAIATGGGAVVDPANRARMLAGNLVVFLDSSAETLAGRLIRSLEHEPRPLLVGHAGGGGTALVARLNQLAREREQHYRCAHHTVRSDHRTPREVADEIARLVRWR